MNDPMVFGNLALTTAAASGAHIPWLGVLIIMALVLVVTYAVFAILDK